MRVCAALLKHEFRLWFFSPSGYIVPACYYILAGWWLVDMLQGAEGSYTQIETLFSRVTVLWLPVVVAAVTMRSFSRARADKSIEVLLSSPVRDSQIIAAKFISSWILVMLVAAGTLIPMGVIVLYGRFVPEVDTYCVIGAVLGVGLLVALWNAIGILISLLTKDQGAACVATLLVTGIPVVIGDSILPLPVLSAGGLPYHPIYTHLSEMSSGLLSMSSFVIFGGGTVVVLFVCVRVLESLRWR